MKLRKNTGIRESNPTEELLNEELISRAMWECLKDGDYKGFMEIIEIYIAASNKSQIAKKASIARSTLYDLGVNPTVKTLAKVVHACA